MSIKNPSALEKGHYYSIERIGKIEEERSESSISNGNYDSIDQKTNSDEVSIQSMHSCIDTRSASLLPKENYSADENKLVQAAEEIKYDNSMNDQIDIIKYERCRIRVIVRVRSPNRFEQHNSDLIKFNQQSIIVNGKSQSRKFKFDAILNSTATQEEVFEVSGIKHLVEKAIDGYVNCSF